MSILTDLMEKKITWHVAETEAEQWASNIVAHDPALSAAAGTILSDVKQAASNAITLADTALGQWIVPASKGVEVALETFLAGATKGVSVPFNSFVSDGIDAAVAAAVAEAHAWGLRTKARLAAPPVTAVPIAPHE